MFSRIRLCVGLKVFLGQWNFGFSGLNLLFNYVE